MNLISDSPLLQVEQLSIQHGAQMILEPFDWVVQTGERWAILGANGAGKTSILHALLGIHAPSAQKIRLNGHKLNTMSVRQQAELRMWVPQRYEEPFTLTVAQALNCMTDDLNQEAADLILKQYGLFERAHHWVHTLSGGERQRLTWAMSAARLTAKTQLWLLDEPFAAQDLAWQDTLLKYLDSAPCAVIAAVHDLNQVSQFATHVLLIKKNVNQSAQVIKAGTLDEVMQIDILSQAYGVQLNYLQAEQGCWWQVES
ncbi:ABC transporter ATP-binding protein [Hydromonas duriensis]|uniref:Iron complex transport system ATP-binding protein n=1 Tax=Hydromonas duriensis TaxID=1527608 RepID=A0A4R6YAY4_9BURK|nr:ABC transporter ATP-binding protein [Hydromonas duriensis]TDR32720.1 iron complex transport system ATP-binding protein [Hydromonas duriensis]